MVTETRQEMEILLFNNLICFAAMRNSFNLLLIALSIFDILYLTIALMEACRKEFGLATRAHIMIFPYLLYPLHTMALTGSIFLTVTISIER